MQYSNDYKIKITNKLQSLINTKYKLLLKI